MGDVEAAHASGRTNMSRTDKQQRRKRRKELDRRRPDALHGRQRLHELLRANPSLQLLEYDIIDGPMEDDLPDPGVKRLTAEGREKLFDQVKSDPRAAIAALETLVRQNPDSRVLRNWLYVALNNAGDSEAADRLTLENFGRFPNYLFARIAMAELHMQQDDLAQAAAVLDNKFDLKAMYPHRSVFHISEYLGLSALAVQYMMRTGNRQAAERLYEIMSQIAPDHPLTKKVENVIMGSVLLRAIEG